MNISNTKRFRIGSALALLALIGATALAQTNDRRPPIIIEPPIIVPPPRPRPLPILNQELQLQSQKADVRIEGAVARTKLTQEFRNTSGHTIEGTYVFPLPQGAAVSGFAMTVNGKRMEAEILEGDKAREIYTGIVRQMRDPAILEFIDRNLIQAKIFPIAPNATQTMELEYSETLKADSNSFRYVVPLRLPTGGAAREASVDIQVRQDGGVKAAYSPTHDIEVKREGDTARISGEWKSDEVIRSTPARSSTPGGGSDRDFVLYLTTARDKIGVNLITHESGGEDGYFMVLVAPDAEIAQKEIAAKDVVFVFDTSGSMAGEKIEQARNALTTLLPNLNPNDRFNIITFSSSTRSFRDGLVGADAKTLDAARDWIKDIKAVGGTNINDALIEGLKMVYGRLAGAERPQQIVFMTDGQPTVGETDVSQILKNVRAANPGLTHTGPHPVVPQVRLFAFGVGYDVNTRLLDTLAEDNRGASDYVLPNEDIEQKVGALYSKIAYPVLSNPRLDWGGAKVYDVYPKNLPDLFRGTQTTVFGRFEGSSRAKPQLIGTSLGREEKIGGQGSFDGADKSNDLLPRLWATRKVGYLLDEVRRSGRTVDNEVKDEIIKLSKKYGIVTPFTAGLITEDDRSTFARGDVGGIGGQVGNGDPSLRDQPAGAPGPVGAPAEQLDSLQALAGYGGGSKAIAASKATNELRDTTKLQKDAGLRYLDGKAFALRDGVWTDTTYDAAKSPKIEEIKFGSDAYFKLLNDAKVAKWLSLGEKVLFVLDGRTVKIVPA